MFLTSCISYSLYNLKSTCREDDDFISLVLIVSIAAVVDLYLSTHKVDNASAIRLVGNDRPLSNVPLHIIRKPVLFLLATVLVVSCAVAWELATPVEKVVLNTARELTHDQINRVARIEMPPMSLGYLGKSVVKHCCLATVVDLSSESLEEHCFLLRVTVNN